MNSTIYLKTPTRSLVIIGLTLAYFAFLERAQAVVPPPDGGYPGFNTAEGQNALFSLDDGAANTAVGWFSLFTNTDGSFNTATGVGSLLFNTADANTAFGAAALLFNTTGSDNTAVGTAALENNTATGNTAVGSRALFNNTTGGTLENIQGLDVGPNVAVGWQALESNTVASANTAVGYQALQSFTTGPVGLEQLGASTAVGFQALANATGSGFANSAFGYKALINNTDGGGNTAIGLQALLSNSTGSGNVAIGNNALSNSTAGSSNVALGFNAGAVVTTASNVICIGTFGDNVSDSCYIGNIYENVQPIVGTNPDSVTITMSGRLGRGNVSSRRYKHDIKPMDKASEALYALKPVSFRYKKQYDDTQTLAFGLIAEEVAEVYPDLVGRNRDGQPESVRYEQINAMLLNEFLEEHRKVEEQQATIAQLTKDFHTMSAQHQGEIRLLTAQLKEQASQIQKVRTQVEASKSITRVVVNEP